MGGKSTLAHLLYLYACPQICPQVFAHRCSSTELSTGIRPQSCPQVFVHRYLSTELSTSICPQSCPQVFVHRVVHRYSSTELSTGICPQSCPQNCPQVFVHRYLSTDLSTGICPQICPQVFAHRFAHRVAHKNFVHRYLSTRWDNNAQPARHVFLRAEVFIQADNERYLCGLVGGWVSAQMTAEMCFLIELRRFSKLLLTPPPSPCGIPPPRPSFPIVATSSRIQE